MPADKVCASGPKYFSFALETKLPVYRVNCCSWSVLVSLSAKKRNRSRESEVARLSMMSRMYFDSSRRLSRVLGSQESLECSRIRC